MVVAPSKTKLLIMATPELRAARCRGIDFTIKVGHTRVTATPSKKLLGVVLSQDFAWHSHLWGETWREKDNIPGVIPQLIQRLGLLKYLSRLSSRDKMRSFIPGIFTSKVLYALPLIGNVLGLSKYAECEFKRTTFTRQDLDRLQSLQHQPALLVSPTHPTPYLTPKSQVLDGAGWLSIHQLIAYHILSTALGVISSGKPISPAIPLLSLL